MIRVSCAEATGSSAVTINSDEMAFITCARLARFHDELVPKRIGPAPLLTRGIQNLRFGLIKIGLLPVVLAELGIMNSTPAKRSW